jgi:ubiquinone/menaquinone biosynthesis C-methylase UbiE
VYTILPAAFVLTACLLVGACGAGPATDAGAPQDSGRHYSSGPASPGGTGRFYMGREIAWVMGHEGAGWLERDTREEEERTDLLLTNLPLDADDVVADIGAGTGYFSLPLAARLPRGRILAVDIQQEMLDIIAARARAAAITNVETILAAEDDPRLPEGVVDLVLLVDAYHEFSRPREVMMKVVRALKPDGRVVLIEYRGEDPTVPIRELHKMTEQQARREMAAVGLEWVETKTFLPQQHFMIFRKGIGAGAATSPAG